MVTRVSELTVFHVRCTGAHEVTLMLGAGDHPKLPMSMRQVAPGQWETRLALLPGSYRYRYYSRFGDTVLYWAPEEIARISSDGHDAIAVVPAAA